MTISHDEADAPWDSLRDSMNAQWERADHTHCAECGFDDWDNGDPRCGNCGFDPTCHDDECEILAQARRNTVHWYKVQADGCECQCSAREVARVGLSVPHVSTVEAMFEHFDTLGRTPTPSEIDVACGRVGRIPAVGLLVELYYGGMLTPEAAAANVGSVWSCSEYPDRHATRADWRALFALAGYTEDGKPAELPTEPLTLWRGSVTKRRTDWSWTDSREVAERYAGGEHYRRPLGVLWQATVDPWRLLAKNTERDEHEYVVDTQGMTITSPRRD